MVTGESPPTVVTGFRRLSASAASGARSVNVLSIPGDRLGAWLEDASLGAPLSDQEKIALTVKASALAGPDFKKISAGLSKIFGREITDSFLDRIVPFASLGAEVQEHLHHGRLSIGDLLDLSGHPGIETETAASIVGAEKLSRSDRRKVVTLMLRLADRGEKAWEEIVGACKRGDIPLRELLERTIFPTMSSDIDTIGEIVKSAGFPPEVSVHLPENMEGGGFKFEIKVRDGKRAVLALDRLRDAFEKGNLGQLLDILKGKRDLRD
jgi:hypothetical protein